MTGGDIELGLIEIPAERMRALRPVVVEQLVESMALTGLLQPIVVQRHAGRYRLVAGVHRFNAAKKLKWPSIRVSIAEDMDVDAVLLAELDENLIRADLSPAERALHLAERKRLYEKLHPETKKGATGKYRQKSQIATSEKLAPAFIDDAAKKTGKHRATIAREVARAEKIVGLADVVGTALDKGEELERLSKLPEAVQRDLIERVKAGEKVTAKHVAKKLKREARERELAGATATASQALGRKCYGVIYADPPWKFDFKSAAGMTNTCADNHYPTMQMEAIKSLNVPATENAVLFLWSTVPMLPQVIEVMAGWGFTARALLLTTHR